MNKIRGASENKKGNSQIAENLASIKKKTKQLGLAGRDWDKCLSGL